MRTVNANPHLNPNHIDLFKAMDTELIVYGGANAGKSYSIADKLLLNTVSQPKKKIRILVIRQTFPSLRNTALYILEERAELFGLPWDLNKNEWQAKCANLTFIFLSLHTKEDYKKLKSLTNIDFIWINEATEIREDDYEECLRRLRGGESVYEQIIIDFNPVGKFNWVYKRFFQDNIGNARKLKYTILDNHPEYLKKPSAQRELQRLKNTKNYNFNLYQIYFLGEWGDLKGIIFTWDIVEKPGGQFYDEIFNGGDFGFSVDPAALIRIYRKADEFWLEELIYETGLTNQALGKKMKALDCRQVSYWDSAEPKSIQELYDLGINAKPCQKGPDSVKAGIDFLLTLKIHIINGSQKIIDEQKSYVYQEDKDGYALPIPVDFNNHAMSATRYGIYTHCHTEFGETFWSEETWRD